MPVFNCKYLDDNEIWLRLNEIEKEYKHVLNLLGQPDISSDPERLPELARRFHHLEKYCLLAEKLKSYLKDLCELERLLKDDNNEENNDNNKLHQEYTNLINKTSQELYLLLLENGYIDEEIEDKTDLDILKFVEYAGPEYAWRLGINIGIGVEESRERLEMLLKKGLLEKVEGTMLTNYHREKDWTKHMNHTYYRISREGRHYLRRLRNSGQNY